MSKIEFKLIELISLFDYLVFKENFSAHQKLLKLYKECWRNIKGKREKEIVESDFAPLLSATRIFFEALPNDKKLTEYLIKKTQEFYEIQEKLLSR
ncbi:hypothetical protein [Joostella sp. CR20]|uniref:hypothetical protein n=1 Tax=Joostella sp. CR20 TaxID=2804312 RepID=UPI00313BD363